MKKNWKIILVCLFLITLLGFGIKNLKIEKPLPSNQIVETEKEDGATDLKGEDEASKAEEKVNEEKVASKEPDVSKASPKKEETPKAQGGNVTTPTEKESKNYCTFSITCNTILKNMDKFDKKKEAYLKGGTILGETNIEFQDGETVLDLLIRIGKNNRIKIDRNGGYISGINNIMEKDCGDLSGWMYSVNGEFPSYGADSYKLKKGDKVKWLYTCDLGKDLK